MLLALSSRCRQQYPSPCGVDDNRAYSGDGSNPHLTAFVERHLRECPYDPCTDRYCAKPFDRRIETTKNSPVYALHGYHLGKKPHDAIEAFIAHYTKPGDLVLDPFAGSGTTALAALLLGRKAIAIDASPAATFIARYYVAPVEARDFAARFERLCAQVADELQWLYATRCHRCGGPAVLHYVVYANSYACPRCGQVVSLYEASHAARPPCCPHCLSKGAHIRVHPGLGVHGCVPAAVSFSCRAGCRPARSARSCCGAREEQRAFREIDLARIDELERLPIPHPLPSRFMMDVHDRHKPWGDEWRPSRDFRTVQELFTHRNLWALAAMMHAAGDDLDLRALITSGMFAVSRKAQHLEGGGGYIPGNWALPPMTKQRNVLESMTKVFGRALKAREQIGLRAPSREVCISTQSATNLSAIPDSSVDFIFTDPPYAGTVQYAELNFIWEAWLGLRTDWHHDEIIVNRTRGKSEAIWAERMTCALRECARVLKPGRTLSICYHDSSSRSWELLLRAIDDAGLVHDAADAASIDTGGRSFNQYRIDKVTKRELVINLRKPRRTEVRSRGTRQATSLGDAAFRRKARSIIRDFLRAHPGSTKDRVYDALVTGLVRNGQLRAHDFEALLQELAVDARSREPAQDAQRDKFARWVLRAERH